MTPSAPCPLPSPCRLQSRVIGQDDACESASRAIMRASSGLKNPDRPIATLLFSGPTGVGKTELTKVRRGVGAAGAAAAACAGCRGWLQGLQQLLPAGCSRQYAYALQILVPPVPHLPPPRPAFPPPPQVLADHYFGSESSMVRRPAHELTQEQLLPCLHSL